MSGVIAWAAMGRLRQLKAWCGNPGQALYPSPKAAGAALLGNVCV